MRPRSAAALLLTLASCAAACQLVWSYDDFKDKPSTTSSGSQSGSSGSGGGGSGGSTSSSSGCVDAGAPCDCDGDGDNAATAECDFDGGDCNDHDPLVSSKQGQFFHDDAGSNGWDYNCNNTVDFEYTGPIHCPLLAPCETPPQYLGAPPFCGEEGAYATCVQFLIFCVQSNELGLLTQGCR